MSKETKSLGRKNIFDKFYTKDSVVDFCLSKIDFFDFEDIIEPSAGNGAFSKKIKDVIALDISPENSDIIKQDFFEFNYQPFLDKRTLVIGNPPFGEQGQLAIRFFNQAALFADVIAFILPKSFKKISIQNRLSLDFSLKEEYELSENAFLLEGKDYNVPCIFQIWIKTEEPRKKKKLKLESKYIEFTKTKELADFRVQRVGGNAGKAFLDKNGAVSSNYYIINHSRLSNEDFVELLNTLQYPTITFTVGPKSLPKGEFIEEIERCLIQ